MILVIHQDHNDDEDLVWDLEDGAVGVDWYLKMTKMTLTTEGWGTYDQGIVSRSGLGDGGYQLYTARVDGEVVAMAVDFAVEEEPVIDFEFFK
jgi:hypothetical protein